MKIVIDISPIIYGTGVSQYTQKLVEHLLKVDKKNKYSLFGFSLRRIGELKNKTELLSGNATENRLFTVPPTFVQLLWNKLHILPIEKLVGNIDVYHSSDWVQAPSGAFKVTTVHDLIPLKFPKLIHPKIVQNHKKRLQIVKREVDRIIVPSESTKLDLLSFGVEEGRIRVIPEAPVLTKASKKQVERVKKEQKIYGDYLVAIASGPYKNVENTIRAFELASAGKKLKLVLVGRQSIKLAKESRNVRVTGYLSQNKIEALLTGASALVFASLYEGFGQPILNAFACQTPVVTSNISSMPEIAGEAAILVDPTDTRSIATGIEEALSKPKTLIAKGLKQLEKFSWQKTAQKTLDVYNEVLDQPS